MEPATEPPHTFLDRVREIKKWWYRQVPVPLVGDVSGYMIGLALAPFTFVDDRHVAQLAAAGDVETLISRASGSLYVEACLRVCRAIERIDPIDVDILVRALLNDGRPLHIKSMGGRRTLTSTADVRSVALIVLRSLRRANRSEALTPKITSALERAATADPDETIRQGAAQVLADRETAIAKAHS
jgi:hypothetical protein